MTFQSQYYRNHDSQDNQPRLNAAGGSLNNPEPKLSGVPHMMQCQEEKSQ